MLAPEMASMDSRVSGFFDNNMGNFFVACFLEALSNSNPI